MVKYDELMICNTDSRSHTDYGVPIVANKSTDYRTTTSSFHGYVPENPGDFHCRVKVNLKNDLKYGDPDVNNSLFLSTTKKDYVTKHSQSGVCENFTKAPRADKNYTRNTQEKIFASPPMPMVPKISEMKDNYRMNYVKPNVREVMAPAITAICAVQGLGRDEQPPARPENKGFWKWLDPYLTTNNSTYIQFSKSQCKEAKQDFPTYYNTNGKWPGFDDVLPAASGKKCIIDNVPFKHQLPNRYLPRIVKRVPNSGITTEYSSNYLVNSKSDLSAYIQAPGEEIEQSVSSTASAWQNLVAPGMYCTEYCQIGTGRSARNTIAIDATQKTFVHKPCHIKLN